MTLRQLYEAVSRQTDMNEGRFISLYKTTMYELCGQYMQKYVCPPDISLNEIESVNEKEAHFPEYDSCIISNILYLNSPQNTQYKEMSLSQREYAYRIVWSRYTTSVTKCRRWN